MDYIFRWLDLTFQQRDISETLNGLRTAAVEPASAPAAAVKASEAPSASERRVFVTQADAPPCHVCSSLMVRSGSCYKCLNCGATSGCS
jgi:ribonucleoside-diphosphate reductase alpha chain